MSRSEYHPPGPVIYSAACTGNARNCLYPDQHVITDAESLRAAVAHDYTGALFRDNYRSLENFISTNCLIPDCDNDHSDDPADWFTPEMLREALPGVMMGIHFSRNHMKQKANLLTIRKFNDSKAVCLGSPTPGRRFLFAPEQQKPSEVFQYPHFQRLFVHKKKLPLYQQR